MDAARIAAWRACRRAARSRARHAWVLIHSSRRASLANDDELDREAQKVRGASEALSVVRILDRTRPLRRFIFFFNKR